MTVNGCIDYIDGIEPNAYTAAQKALWLGECEGKVYTSLFLAQPAEFTPVAYDADRDRTLAVPAPYDRIYPRYLQAMIHYANGEYDRYANSMAAFNEVWHELCVWFGQDFDVSDRRRNRKVTAEVAAEVGEQTVFTVPEGCALAAGRITVREAFGHAIPRYKFTSLAEAGTFTAKPGDEWVHFDTTGDPELALGFEIGDVVDFRGAPYSDAYVVRPSTRQSWSLELTSGKSGTVLELDRNARATIGGEDAETPVTLDEKGTIPLPMVIADSGGETVGVTLGPGYWTKAGRIVFTGRLLIPDEEFPFN